MSTFCRNVTAFLIAVSGAAVMCALVWPLSLNALPFISLAGCAAYLAGLLCSSFFGLPGHGGAGLAVLGAILATLIGAAVAGLVFGLWTGPTLGGAVAAPIGVILLVFTYPPAMLAWSLTMAVAHFVTLRLRCSLAVPR